MLLSLWNVSGINPFLPHIHRRGSGECSSKFRGSSRALHSAGPPRARDRVLLWGDDGEMDGWRSGAGQTCHLHLCVKPHYTIALFILRLKTAGVHHSSKHCVLTARHNEKQHGNSYCLYAVVPSLSRPVLWNPSPLPWKHCTKLLFHTSHEIKNKFIEPEVYLKIRRLFML